MTTANASAAPTDALADLAMGAAVRRCFGGEAPGRDLPGGTLLAVQGEPVEDLTLMLEGRALAERRFQGDAVPVGELTPGVLVGLEGVCGTGRHGLTVRALGPVRTMTVPRRVFLDRLRADPEAALLAFTVLSGRLRACIRDTDDLKFQDATVRVARYLLDRLDGVPEQGPARGKLLVSKKTLAAHLGITQQSLSRVFRRLRDDGVSVRGQTIVVEAVERLSVLMEDAS